MDTHQKYNVQSSGEYAICCGSNSGPVFGGGNNIHVANNGNIGNNSWMNWDNSYPTIPKH